MAILVVSSSLDGGESHCHYILVCVVSLAIVSFQSYPKTVVLGVGKGRHFLIFRRMIANLDSDRVRVFGFDCENTQDEHPSCLA